MIPMAVIVWLAALAQAPADPPPNRRARPVRVHSDVRIIIEETPREEYEFEYYEQHIPVVYRSGSSTLSSGIWYRTVCRPQEEHQTPIFLPPPPSPWSPPLSLSATVGLPRVSVTTSRTTLTIGNTRSDPIITKATIFGGRRPDSVSSSDQPFLVGPDLDLVVASDLSTWSPTRWMPAETSLHLYARALFGSFEVFDTPTSLQLYGVGPRLSIPLVKSALLGLDLTLSAGPAFLRTGIGDAVGFDGGIGLRVEHFFTPAFSFLAAAEANLYFSDTVTAFGPVVNLGFNLSW
jgi:hypothetical protein